MSIKRTLISLMVALLVSGAFTLWLSKRVASAAHSAQSATRTYVAVSKALEAGELLKPDDIQLVSWPVSVPLSGGFIRTEDVLGRVVLYPLAKGEPILDRHLAAKGAGVGLTANIPPGMRAISVRSDEVVGVAGFLLPGTHVDVLVTYRPENSAEQRTATVLQNVEVLAAGQQSRPDPEGRPTSVNVVTLLLKPDDAERMVLSTSLGAIHFVLRNGTDRAQTDNPAVGVGQLAAITSPYAGGTKHIAARATHIDPPAYVVETILGTTQHTSRFK